MKKRVELVFLFIVFITLLAPMAFAQNDTSFDAAYTCLEDLVTQRGYSDLTPEEQSFALLALSYDATIQGELRSALADNSYNNICWPSDDCRVKDTAIALIALDNINQPTNLVENWLMQEAEGAGNLNWYLQIDTSSAADCTVSYPSGSKDITVQDDKRITGAGGDCLSSAYNGYWLEIDEDCHDDSLDITCDQSFVTSLTYSKSSGEQTYYVSSITHSAPADGKTTEAVNSLCFTEEDSDACTYEGSLWSALALKKMGKDTSAYLPYLIALAPDNSQYLPSAFLYMLDGDSEYFTTLINKQKTDGYWQTTSDSMSRYYDTALAILSLQGRSAEQATTATNWLLENQQSSGCWNNARDTGFILYAAAPKNPDVSGDRVDCEDSGYFCVSTSEDCENAVGTVKSGYYCSALGQSVCCDTDVQEPLPDIEPGGDIDEDNECEERNYYCKSYCNTETEEEKPYSCSGIQACCAPATDSDEGISGWWIWFLVILIILLALAIWKRNQVRVWLFRIRSKFKKGPVTQQRRPPYPPGAGPARPGMPRRMLPPGASRPGMMPHRPMPRPGPMPRQMGRRPGPIPRGRRGPFPKEDQLQATLQKLRDMGR